MIPPMPIPIRELEAAGLYDPAAPDAAERLALIEWLMQHGATVEQMVRCARRGSLSDVAGELGRSGGPLLTLAEAAARTGISVERIRAIRFASGLPEIEPDVPAVTEATVRSLGVFDEGERLFGTNSVRRFTQVLGGALARAAEAAISLSLANLMAPILSRGGGELEIAKARYRSGQTVGPLATAAAELFRAHVVDAARRLDPISLDPSLSTTAIAVGFVDLVGFTPLARRIDARALAAVIDRFEETAHDVATAAGGRVVKFIGDEVMFVAHDAAAACDIALTLIERCAGDESVTPRGAVAAGDVLVRGGDYYGPTVNLAARMADLAVPGEILVTEETAALAGPTGLHFEAAGRRTLKGFEAPVRLLSVERTDRQIAGPPAGGASAAK
jgi:adenylate cyclase